MNTIERMQGYHPFPAEITEVIDHVAQIQQRYDYVHLFRGLGINDPIIYNPKHSKPVEVLDIIPKGDYDGGYAQVLHLPHGNDLGANMVYHAATIYAADPSKRTIAFANPSLPGSKSGLLSHSDRKKVVSGNLRPTIDPVIEYLSDKKIDSVRHIGWSLGADKAVAAAQFADNEVVQTISIEPASVKKRGLIELLNDFKKTADHLDRYVDVTELKAFKEAREAGGGSMARYVVGLMRLSNIAIGRALASDGFETRASAALEQNPEMKLTNIWGSESELAVDGITQAITCRLAKSYGPRVRGTRIEGQFHNMTNDVHLLAALVLNSQR